MQEAYPLWPSICEYLRPRIGETAFEAWVKPIRPCLDQNKQTLSLEVPNEFFRDWIIEHYDITIRDLLKNSDPGLHIEYKIIPGDAVPPPSLPVVKTAQRIVANEGFILNPKYTFENFVVGPSNRFTHAACLSIAESPAKAYNPLFIYGKVGLGKTHLMQAICHFIRQKNPGSRFYFSGRMGFDVRERGGGGSG